MAKHGWKTNKLRQDADKLRQSANKLRQSANKLQQSANKLQQSAKLRNYATTSLEDTLAQDAK